MHESLAKERFMNTEPTQAKATKTSFVYDTRTGKVVHVHQFIPAAPGGTCSDSEMETMALKLAPAAWDRAQLGVLHDDGELELNPEHRYRVDVQKLEVVFEPAPTAPTQARRREGPARD
jgi:hypothetical protein